MLYTGKTPQTPNGRLQDVLWVTRELLMQKDTEKQVLPELGGPAKLILTSYITI